ncbi:MAG: hypothetical protein ISR57_04410 [Bacteroidales bacterium]|nr:hypothetical protein [Bacteroidota bacterium]MBL6949869.1 hypothetical protein [Bacteroidales bacterium]
MDRRNALKTLFAFIPLGVGFAGITAMGIRFITPNKKDVCYTRHARIARSGESHQLDAPAKGV